MLHLLAIAREAGVALTLDDFDAISARDADASPTSSRAAASSRSTCHAAGGIALLARGSCGAGSSTATRRRVSGRTLRRGGRAASRSAGPGGGRAASEPLKQRGGLAILRGNLAPDGCVVKLAGPRAR